MKLYKLYFFVITIVFILVSCEDSKPQADANTTDNPPIDSSNMNSKAKFAKDARNIGPDKPKAQFAIEDAHANIVSADEHYMIGYWTGQFGKNKITLVLHDVADGKVSGHSVCAGNYRLITGTEKEVKPHIYDYVLTEPGDHKHDGKFEFSINLNNNTLVGTWTPFKTENNSPREYALTKKMFEYNASNGDYPQGSQRALTDVDVENLDAYNLKIMRNEIYARHGYSFKTKEMRMHFEKTDWYMPIAVDVREDLKDIEVENIDLIYQYETYYEEYYDDYGR